MSSSKQNYRAELDGVRALAVFAVLLYHLEVSWISGGFTGVDVFFVLSGYLITGLIERQITNGDFRYREFFVRRVRRLAPALALVTIVTSFVAFFILTPRYLVPFANSVWVQPFALQNIHFMVEGEYFDGAGTKLLLHTWSLGVEEQFYLFWPPLLLFMLRFKRGVALLTLTLLICASFLLNLGVMEISPKASFFLLPTRAWEMGLGGLLALLHKEGRCVLKGNQSTIVAFVSLITLGAGFWWIDGSMRFPGWVALVPAVATFALLSSIQHCDILRKTLSLRPIVFVGAISYSLYLWHWPLIVAAKFLDHDVTSMSTRFALIFLSFAASIGAYYLVETPIRRGKALTSRIELFAVLGTYGVLSVAFSHFVTRTDGLAFRYEEPTKSMLTASLNSDGDERCGFLFRALNPTKQVCKLEHGNGKRILLWGNSHAGMWIGVFNELAVEHNASLYLNSRNCRPTPDGDFCSQDVQRSILKFIKEERITDVILASTWYGSYGINDADFEASLREVVHALAEMEVRAWLVVDIPRGDVLDPEFQFRLNPQNPQFGKIPFSQHDVGQREREVRLFEDLASRNTDRIRIIDITNAYCPEQFGYGGERTAWYRDSNHVTSVGARLAKPYFERIFHKEKLGTTH